MLNKKTGRVFGVYICGITIIFFMIWMLLDMLSPGTSVSFLGALSTAFGVQMPEGMAQGDVNGRMVLIIFLLSVFSMGLVLLHVYFASTVTASLINPEIKLLTSSFGVLSDTWNPERPFMLVRLSNFHKNDLMNVELEAVITVEEEREGTDGAIDQFLSYLPVTYMTPKKILVLRPKTPWSIAVPADMRLGNSLVRDYEFKPGNPILKSFTEGKKLVSCKRHLEVLIRGVEPGSYAQFAKHCKILIDEQQGEFYTLHLHKGSFKSLPLTISVPADLEKVA